MAFDAKQALGFGLQTGVEFEYFFVTGFLDELGTLSWLVFV